MSAVALHLAEKFGPTFQGEGPSSGRLAAFVRFGGCNLKCGRGLAPGAEGMRCDTPYTWDATRFRLRDEISAVPLEEVTTFLEKTRAPLVVITGGEPLLHQRTAGFRSLIEYCVATGRDVEIETNGTLVPDPALTRPFFNVSPKLANAGDELAKRLVPAALEAFAELARAGRARFKFVACGPAELSEIEVLATQYDISPKAIWIMPEGQVPGVVVERAQRLADPVLAHGWNLSLRQHVLLWPTERAR